MVKNNLTFFRNYFKIPRKYKLSWCVIVVYSDERKLRLGVNLVGSGKIIDVAKGEFARLDSDYSCDTYTAFNAVRKSRGDFFEYHATNGSVLTLPKTFVNDVFYKKVYSEELMNDPLKIKEEY